ncbi:hypothetical protein FOA52_011076 [Chlamydomonas sp. UWO 241]|nr:hypothetical protein FOA52_011076 [Chlamydomonas sp. UWO 241]
MSGEQTHYVPQPYTPSGLRGGGAVRIPAGRALDGGGPLFGNDCTERVAQATQTVQAILADLKKDSWKFDAPRHTYL